MSDGANAAEPTIAERLTTREERIHVSIGAVCNNNCIFCMEEDRDGRYVNNSAMTTDRVRWILEQNQGSEEVCFTSGEPTTRPELPDLVSMAKGLGYRKISVMTNGRRLSHLPYAALLAKAGMNRFYVSIHGHTKKLHEGLTRTPDSFEQTVAGLASITKLKRFGVELHTSTVLTDRNLPHMLDIYRFLRQCGVDQVVFNVMQANGRADTYFEQIFPRYTEIADTFRRFLADVGEPRPMAFLVDIPLCTTEGVADFNRGYVERYRHFDLGDQANLVATRAPERAADGRGRGLVLVTRQDLDEAQRDKRQACGTCKYGPQCEGVWRNYLKRYGWDEFEPILGPPNAR
ncbi:radical SAM protein HxsC4 [Polyangium sorediatum]|uniref:Radical SAM protein HxsC4 n=1 Tax=Polyangium sorediatum TaxID=889274 RepID=A0ABT6P883_9BACT|nr:radical SAM protein HxsC4 [Polyangium sorediatum]MDI1436826.1 radical SAM protein HxsC4 [Polyangium sorediatum]